MKQIQQHLQSLRTLMRKHNIAAVIVPGTDPHASEYSPSHWKEREWISGFNGSAGTVVVTTTDAGLWTDSRYFLQAEEQLSDSGIRLFKDGLIETPSIETFLIETLAQGECVAVNAEMFSIAAINKLQNELQKHGINLNTEYDLLGEIWTNNRPSLPSEPIFCLPETYTGKSAKEKISNIRTQLKANTCNAVLYSGLDEVAWLFNIRGNDVDFNPVAIAYAFIDETEAYLFIDLKKLTAEVVAQLAKDGITPYDYSKITDFLSQLPNKTVLALDYNRINFALFRHAHCEKRQMPSAVIDAKSIKNEIELKGIRSAMIRDGVALTKFLKWLEENIGKNALTELSISEKLKKFRSEQQLFAGESFNTIAGYAAHGAIVHYAATTESDATLKPDNFLLLDSGGQYFDGTTDITRTIALGEPTAQQKTDFTLVLKGHIALAQAKFPYGTRGVQLDILARQYLWQHGLNYGHGTGHGVGHFLCVHEGPQNIRTDLNPTILKKGMLISNEPGLYRTNQYGIRTENLVTVIECEENEFGCFLAFETLTLCPIDKRSIYADMLSENEKQWLNAYHRTVFERIAPHLTDEERAWLKEKTAEL
ncbi:MAG: aminopeptidase P family protein [Paludibacteraceae bacterium]|nr:aminopeptidase P family protein [Paludibacteraceae bacterium]